MTILSTVLVLILLGLYGIITLHTNNLVDILRQNIKIIVALEDNLNPSEQEAVVAQLKTLEAIKSSTITLIPKSEAINIMEVEISKLELSNLVEGNPFRDMITFQLNKDFISLKKLESLTGEISALPEVYEASFYGTMYEFISKNIRNLSFILLVLGIILGVFAFSLIYATIYLSLYAERFKIRTMELVGASWKQVRKPFVEQAVVISFIASSISIGILIIVLFIMQWRVELVKEIFNIWYILLVFVGIVIFSFAITQLATYIVLKRYLGTSASKLY